MKCGGILYIREDIPSKLVSTESSQVEGFFVEICETRKSGYSVALIIQKTLTM